MGGLEVWVGFGGGLDLGWKCKLLWGKEICKICSYLQSICTVIRYRVRRYAKYAVWVCRRALSG
jgi:hypothetical protein